MTQGHTLAELQVPRYLVGLNKDIQDEDLDNWFIFEIQDGASSKYDAFTKSIFQRIETVMIWNMFQIICLGGELFTPRKQLMMMRLNSSTILKISTNTSYLLATLIVSLGPPLLATPAFPAFLRLPNLPFLWSVTTLFFFNKKKELVHLMHCLLALEAAADASVWTAHTRWMLLKFSGLQPNTTLIH